jgi:hypothetical protein
MRCVMGLLDNDISGILIRRELGVPAGVLTAALKKNFESFFFWLAWYRPDLSDELVRCTSASELIMTFPCLSGIPRNAILLDPAYSPTTALPNE